MTLLRGAAGAVLALATITAACGRQTAVPNPSLSASPSRSDEASFEQSLAPVVPAVPVLQAAIPPNLAEISADLAQSVRAVPGVVAVARVGLGHVLTESQTGAADVSVAWVDPLEFRPLAPEVTARADFVWRGLIKGQVFLAHEESRILAAPSGSVLYMRSPAGQRALRVGGVASNGIPNLGGALISLGQAASMGLGPPNLILVAKDPRTSLLAVQKQLKLRLPTIQFDVTAAGAGRAFLSGPQSAKLFGSFTFKLNEDGTIVPDPNWVSRNIVSKPVPIFGTVRCHRLLLPQLIGALREIERQGLASTIDSADFRRSGGCYVPRLVRGENLDRPVSMHAWGLALDINVAKNPAGAPPNQDARMVAIFEQWGFRWGGRWAPPDAHHFELASLVKT